MCHSLRQVSNRIGRGGSGRSPDHTLSSNGYGMGPTALTNHVVVGQERLFRLIDLS